MIIRRPLHDVQSGRSQLITVQNHCAESQCRIIMQNHCAESLCRITVQNHCAESQCRIIMHNHHAESLCRMLGTHKPRKIEIV